MLIYAVATGTLIAMPVAVLLFGGFWLIERRVAAPLAILARGTVGGAT